jgi:predicted PurR-regulated permease PerM
MSNLNWARLRDQCVVGVCSIVFLYALWWLAQKLLHAIVLILLAIVVAYALEPVLVRLERFMPRIIAALGAYALGAVTLGLAGYFLLGPLASQGQALLAHLPAYFTAMESWLQWLAGQYGFQLPAPGEARGQLASQIQGGVREVLLTAIGVVAVLGALAADVAFVLLLGFWFMVDGQRIRRAIAALVPERYRERVQFVEETISTVLGGYIRGQLTLATIVGVSAGLGCWALGVPYPIVIGFLAFLFELVPMVGPILGSIPAVVIALFQPLPLVFYVAAFFLVIQFVENNILAPRISGHAVGLHPVAALIGLLVGFELGGVIGALFALPAISAASVLVSAAIKGWRGEPVIVRRGAFTFRMPTLRRKRGEAA